MTDEPVPLNCTNNMLFLLTACPTLCRLLPQFYQYIIQCVYTTTIMPYSPKTPTVRHLHVMSSTGSGINPIFIKMFFLI